MAAIWRQFGGNFLSTTGNILPQVETPTTKQKPLQSSLFQIITRVLVNYQSVTPMGFKPMTFRTGIYASDFCNPLIISLFYIFCLLRGGNLAAIQTISRARIYTYLLFSSNRRISLSICSSFLFSNSTRLSIVFPALTLLALPITCTLPSSA